MRKNLLLLCLLAFCATNLLFAQAKLNVDSLTAVLNKYPKDDTVKVKMLIAIAQVYYKGNTDKAIEYAEKSVALAEQLKVTSFLADSYFALGSAFEQKGAYAEATMWFNKALSIFERLNQKVNMAKVYARLGALANAKSDGKNAQQYYQKAISLLDKIKDKELFLFFMSNLASTYLASSEYQKAIDAFDSSLKYYETINDRENIARILSNKSGAHYYLAEYSKSIDCLQRALAINEKMGNQRALMINYSGLATIYNEISEYDKAIDLFKKGIEINKTIKSKRFESSSYSMLGSIYANKSDFKNALIYLEKSNEILKQTNNQAEYARNLGELSKIYLKNLEYSKAYQNNLNLLKISEQSDKTEFVGEAYFGLGDMLLEMPDSALLNISLQPKDRLSISSGYLNKALNIFQRLGTRYSEAKTLESMSKNFEMKKDYIQAYESYKKYIAIKDSTEGDDVKKQITRKEIQYEFDKKETELKYQQQLTAGELEKQRLLTFQQGQSLTLNRQTLTLKEQALALSNKAKDLAHLAFLKEQAEKQEKGKELSLSEAREKGAALDLKLKNTELAKSNIELSAQQKQNLYLGLFAALLLTGLGALLYFYNTLKKKNIIIAQQNEINEQTIAILSHDIKEPLLGVKLLLKKLNKDDPFVAQASQSLENQINSVNGILTNLLKMKKVSLSKKDKNATANVNTVVKNVVQELGVAIQTKNLTIQNDLTDNLNLPIAPEKLQIVVHNLLSNAVKYSFPDQSIRIFQDGKGFSIQDFGVGLSPEQRSKLMREVTASERGTNAERGNGLGLFLVGAMLQGEALKVVFDSPDAGGTIVKVLG